MMAQSAVPFRRLLRITAIFSAAPVCVIIVLAALGHLGAGPAAIAALAIATASALIVRHYLKDLYALNAYVDALTDGGGAPLPELRKRGTLPETTRAIGRLSDSWEKRNEEMSNLALSTEAILENLPQPLILVDNQRRVIRATVAAREILGVDSVGRDLSALLRNPDVLEAADRVIAGGDGEDVEFVVQFPVERAFRAWITALPAAAPDGTAAIVTLYDLTALKRSDQMRVDFVANASHELRTPLAVLLGCIKTLTGSAREDADAQARFLGMMEAQADRMSRLVEDLLSLSRIELNEHTAPSGSVDIAKLIGQVADSLEFPASNREMRVEVNCETPICRVGGDEGELTQLFQNLMDNAIKYGRKETAVRVDIRPAVDDIPPGLLDSDGVISVSVTDEGEGIPPEHIPRLTERFYRVDTGRSRELGGTGLGLAIVKHIVNRHRGTLRIASDVGVGSTFTVFLPAESAETPPPVAGTRVRESTDEDAPSTAS